MAVKTSVYMDHHATTPVDGRVLEAMLPYFKEKFGNAASRHAVGWAAEEGVENAREQVSRLIGAQSKDIVFTSGATESNNLAIKGVAGAYRNQGTHIVTQATEHHAVLDPVRTLKQQGFQVSILPVDRSGQVHPEAVADAITDRTILVSIMAANNEIGTLQPIVEIGRICQERGVLFHTDAAQAVGKIPVDAARMGMDLLSISAHKLYGPKGIGALYVRSRPRIRLIPQMDGGGHEQGMRSGTLNVPGIVGLGAACEIACREMAEEAARIRNLRDRLQTKILNDLDDVHLNGHPQERLDGNLNLSFAHIDGESLLMGVSEIALSSGSACTSATLEPSYVIRAIGLGSDLARGSIRFGLGRFTTQAEVDYVADRVIAEVTRLREISPHYRS